MKNPEDWRFILDKNEKRRSFPRRPAKVSQCVVRPAVHPSLTRRSHGSECRTLWRTQGAQCHLVTVPAWLAPIGVARASRRRCCNLPGAGAIPPLGGKRPPNGCREGGQQRVDLAGAKVGQIGWIHAREIHSLKRYPAPFSTLWRSDSCGPAWLPGCPKSAVPGAVPQI